MNVLDAGPRWRRAAAMLLLAAAAPVQAASFCVASTSELIAALSAAQSNGQNDLIRLVAGTYPISSRLVHFSQEGAALHLWGGYAPGCATLAQAGAKSVIEGNGSTALLDLMTDGSVTMTRMVWRNGRSQPISNAVLMLVTGDQSYVTISQSAFLGLNGYADENVVRGPVFIRSGGELLVANSVFSTIDGVHPGRAAVSLDADSTASNGARIINNTFAGNRVAAASAADGGVLDLASGASWTIANNVLWGNQARYDLRFGAGVHLYHNDIGAYAGTPVDGIGSNLSVDPRFVDAAAGNYRLRRESPLRNAGIGILAGVDDYDDHPRVAEGLLDIGAWEIPFVDLIMADGFDG